MRDRLRRLAFPAAFAALAAVIAVGLVAAPPRPVDRVDALAARLRCPTCQGESVADSPSETATGIRAQIDEFVRSGWSDEQVLDYYVARYSQWVLLDPPAAGSTLLLWLLPLAVAVAGVAVVARNRRRARLAPLDEERREAVREALAELRRSEDVP
jgi:cytochrome c-type biogenesis protein CcmH